MTVQIRFKADSPEFTPTKAHETDAGWDVYSAESLILKSDKTVAVSIGVVAAIPEGYCIVIKERSGMALTKSIRVGGGVIDSAYRGTIKVILHNLSDYDYPVSKLQKIAQLLVLPVPKVEFINVGEEALDITARGENGFGSTGN